MSRDIPDTPSSTDEVVRLDDPDVTVAAFDMVKILGHLQARQLLALLELPAEDRDVRSSMLRESPDGFALLVVLEDVEKDETGRYRERLITGLRSVLG